MEQRRLNRFKLNLPATIEVLDEDDGKSFTLVTTDVSAGGAFFTTEQPLREGTNVKIDLVLAIEEIKKLTGRQAQIHLTGKVVRSCTDGMAVCFDNKYRIRSL